MRRRRRRLRHVAINWRALADGRVHALRRGVDFAHPVNAMADLAKVAAGRLGMTALVMVDNLGSYELMWVQFVELETVADEPCPACGSPLVPRTRVLARCSACRRLVVVRPRRERASPEAIALLDKALGRSRAPGAPRHAAERPAMPEQTPLGEPRPTKGERSRRGERPPKGAPRPKAERPARGARRPKGERPTRAERPTTAARPPKAERPLSPEQLSLKQVRSEMNMRYGRRLEDFQELELFLDEDESEATAERYYGHGIDPSGNVSIVRVDFPLDESGQRLPDGRNEGEDLYKLLVMPLSTFERLGQARFDADDDRDDDDEP